MAKKSLSKNTKIPKKTAKAPAAKKSGARSAKLPEAEYAFGFELVETCVAICRTCDEQLCKPTTKKAKAQRLADEHLAENPGHDVEVICSGI